jgi:ATP-dependent DNA helicase DinG
LKSAANIFDIKGPIASAMPIYEPRKEQVQMARAVEETIEKGGVLLAEAGTGTGKTLAYLVPAILSDLRVIISTGTKNLQEQVYFKEIEFLSRALERTINAVYLKGQDNYLCLRRLSEFLGSPKVLAYSPKPVQELEKWAKSTLTGDRMEVENLRDDDPLWSEVCSTRDTRIGAKCPFNSACFVTKARLEAMRAKLVVVNHHLYFADLATRVNGGSILPDHDVVVFDEAHAIEDVATEFFSTQVSSARVERMLNDVLSAVRRAKLRDDPAGQRRLGHVESARLASAALFEKFRGEDGRLRLTLDEIRSDQEEAYFRLDAALDAVSQSLKQIEGKDEAVNHVSNRLEKLRSDLEKVIGQTEKGYVYWVENQK